MIFLTGLFSWLAVSLQEDSWGLAEEFPAACETRGMSAAKSPTPPNLSWTEDTFLKIPNSDRKLRRWGSVKQACKVLDNCDREVIYDLIAVKAGRGYKLRPHASNSHFKVDMLSVWERKQRQAWRVKVLPRLDAFNPRSPWLTVRLLRNSRHRRLDPGYQVPPARPLLF